MIDTLNYARKLASGGFSREQAEALKEGLAEGRNRLVTLPDLDTAKAELRGEFRPLRIWLGINTALSVAILTKLSLP